MPETKDTLEASAFLSNLHERALRPGGTRTLSIQEAERTVATLFDAKNDLVRRYGEDAKRELETFSGDWQGARQHATAQLQHIIPRSFAPTYISEAVTNLNSIPANPLRTAYEYWYLAANLQIIRYIAGRYFETCPMPLFDTVQIGHVHALVKRFGSQIVLVFQSGTKAFTNLFAKAFVRIWLETAQLIHDSRITTLDAHHELEILRQIKTTDTLREIFHSYLFLGHPIAGMFVDQKDNINLIASKFETAMDRFIVSHEYAHILHRHEPGGEPRQRQNQEKEADRTGLLLMLESWTGDEEDYVIPFCAAHVVIAVQQMIMGTVYSVTGRVDAQRNYSTALERKVNLMAVCERTRRLTPMMEQTALGLLGTLEALYRIIEPSLLETAKIGRPLAHLWQGA